MAKPSAQREWCYHVAAGPCDSSPLIHPAHLYWTPGHEWVLKSPHLPQGAHKPERRKPSPTSILTFEPTGQLPGGKMSQLKGERQIGDNQVLPGGARGREEGQIEETWAMRIGGQERSMTARCRLPFSRRPQSNLDIVSLDHSFIHPSDPY